MKKLAVIAAVGLGLSLAACTKNANKLTTAEVLNSGTWHVSYFWDNDHEETSDFAGYNFTFDNGTITASNGSSTVTGTYSEGTDDDTPKFIITMNTGTGPFDELNDDWHVIEKTNTLIRLQEESGSGEVEYLNFSKN